MSDNIRLHKSDCALLLGGYQCTCGFHQRQNKTPTALAAETPKQEPVAWMYINLDGECEQIEYGTPPTDDDSITPLYTAPPSTHPGYVIGSHWLETAYSRICAGEAEADVLRDCGWERVDDIKALRRDAERLQEELRQSSIDITRAEIERLRELLIEVRGAKWLVVQDNLLDRIDAALRGEG